MHKSSPSYRISRRRSKDGSSSRRRRNRSSSSRRSRDRNSSRDHRMRDRSSSYGGDNDDDDRLVYVSNKNHLIVKVAALACGRIFARRFLGSGNEWPLPLPRLFNDRFAPGRRSKCTTTRSAFLLFIAFIFLYLLHFFYAIKINLNKWMNNLS